MPRWYQSPLPTYTAGLQESSVFVALRKIAKACERDERIHWSHSFDVERVEGRLHLGVQWWAGLEQTKL